MNNLSKLSRAEMRNVKGGNMSLGTCTFWGSCVSYTEAPTQSYDPSDTGVANNMQGLGDTWCRSHNCCTNVDCPGATTPPEA